jgi:hypothetical protein
MITGVLCHKLLYNGEAYPEASSESKYVKKVSGDGFIKSAHEDDSPGPFDASLYQPTQVRAGKEPVARRSVWPSCSAIHSIRLVNPINHSNHSTPSTINMFLFYLLVHDRTEWQDWTIG